MFILCTEMRYLNFETFYLANLAMDGNNKRLPGAESLDLWY